MFSQYLLFAAQVITWIVALLILFAGILFIASSGKQRSKEYLQVKKLNDGYSEMQERMRLEILEKTAFKKLNKAEKRAEKLRKKIQKEEPPKKRIFVLNFIGDVRASAVKALREEITAILTIATPEDEVVLRLESPGGMVHAYGLAASQLQRIRKQQIPLVAIVDKVAASGGYMMAAVANTILAAPFAVVGSIGVIAQIPNFHRLLKKNNIEFEQITAGQYKRTLTLFGENTRQGRQKFQEEIDETHALFKSFVRENRPQLDMEEVATGEHWYGTQALTSNLIDGIMTSDDYLLTASKDSDLYEISYITRKSFFGKLTASAHKGMRYLLESADNSLVHRQR
jgi:serine protease SohB